jgi:hypothetical protein
LESPFAKFKKSDMKTFFSITAICIVMLLSVQPVHAIEPLSTTDRGTIYLPAAAWENCFP